jgi:hypothetical protein
MPSDQNYGVASGGTALDLILGDFALVAELEDVGDEERVSFCYSGYARPLPRQLR